MYHIYCSFRKWVCWSWKYYWVITGRQINGKTLALGLFCTIDPGSGKEIIDQRRFVCCVALSFFPAKLMQSMHQKQSTRVIEDSCYAFRLYGYNFWIREFSCSIDSHIERNDRVIIVIEHKERQVVFGIFNQVVCCARIEEYLLELGLITKQIQAHL